MAWNWLKQRRQREIKRLKAMPYVAYLLSDHWGRVRAKAIKRAGGRCSICNAKGPLQVHHRTYERLGEERDNDVIALCRKCHARVHGKS